MKKRGLVLTSLFLLIGALAVTGATSLAAFESSKREIKIVGTNGMHGSTIFLSAGVWEEADAAFYLYSWNADGGEVWLSPKERATENGYYVFELDTKAFTNFLFARMDPTATFADDFKTDSSKLWNKSTDLSFDKSKRLYKITGWGTSGQKISVGEWAVYNDN